jgi:hypothetical protein
MREMLMAGEEKCDEPSEVNEGDAFECAAGAPGGGEPACDAAACEGLWRASPNERVGGVFGSVTSERKNAIRRHRVGL